jgi:hypothetical protein
LPVSSAMPIAVSSTVIRPRNASDIQLACLTTVYYSSILNGLVASSILNEVYPYECSCASSPVSMLFEGSEVSCLFTSRGRYASTFGIESDGFHKRFPLIVLRRLRARLIALAV